MTDPVLEPHRKYIDVLIIGASLSGLITAYKIMKKNLSLNILLVERETDPFKRFTENQFVGYNACNWISFEQFSTVNLCKELNIEFNKVYHHNKLNRFWEFEHDKFNVLIKFELDRFVGEIDILSNTSHEINKQYINISMEQYMSGRLVFEYSKNFVRFIVRSVAGVEAEFCSFYDFVKLCNSSFSMSNLIECIVGSRLNCLQINVNELYKRLIKSLSLGMVQFNTEITKITQKSEFVECETAEGDKIFSYIVIPSFKWQKIQKLNFHPKLPLQMIVPNLPKKYMITAFEAEYMKSYWKDANLSGNVLLFYPKYFFAYQKRPKLLSGFMYHTEPDYPGFSVKDLILEHITSVFNNEQMLTPVVWREDTWEQPMILNPATVNTFDKIIFSSTNSAVYNRGLINGEIQGGIYAAYLAILKLRPQSVVLKDVCEIFRARQIVNEFGMIHKLFKSVNLYQIIRYGPWVLGISLAVTFMYARFIRN